MLGIYYTEYLVRSSLFSIVGTLQHLSKQTDWMIILHIAATEKTNYFCWVWFHTCISRATNHHLFVPIFARTII